ncbi:hypothetical protein V492_06995, partial [Pseudogymnoascus sp. VKM F-4246]
MWGHTHQPQSCLAPSPPANLHQKSFPASKPHDHLAQRPTYKPHPQRQHLTTDTMHLMYTLDASGTRIYTLKKLNGGEVTKSAH